MDRKEEREIETKVKKEQGMGIDGEKLYAGIANGIPNEKDQDGDFDAVNANFVQGEVRGSHDTNINTQTDLELGGLENPGGLDPAQDREYLKKMKKNIEQHQ